MAIVSDMKGDIRESCGRTSYVSAGTSQKHKEFRWKIDANGKLSAASNEQQLLGASLAAHRTYINDCLGLKATFVISTVYQGH